MKNQIVLGVMKLWSASMEVAAVAGIAYAVVSLCIGNYSGTYCFEF
jgi:hypothetical protein